jgi:hypothetical protein
MLMDTWLSAIDTGCGEEKLEEPVGGITSLSKLYAGRIAKISWLPTFCWLLLLLDRLMLMEKETLKEASWRFVPSLLFS